MSCTSCECIGLVVVAIIMVNLSSTVRYCLKMLIFFLGSILLATFLPIPLFIIRPRDYRNALGPAWGCRFLLRILGVNYEVRGIENINKTKGGVVLMNHQSAIDLAVLAYLWPIIGRATVIAKRELLYAFPFGTASYLWGTLFINRSDKRDAVNKLNQETLAIQNNAAKLLFFPEGTRHEGDKLLPFKKGAFHIAVQSETSVQPVVVSRYWFLNSKEKIFNRGEIIIQILPEISCKGLTKDDIPTLLEKTQQVMQLEYDKLNAETRPLSKKAE